jgi:uncharacterized protein YjbJ (UPF0337 family)
MADSRASQVTGRAGGQTEKVRPDRRRKSVMGLDDKIKNATQEHTGTAKEKVGEWTGDDDLRTEGKKDEALGSVRQAGEKVKDAFK